jgi:hypothetical protein
MMANNDDKCGQGGIKAGKRGLESFENGSYVP